MRSSRSTPPARRLRTSPATSSCMASPGELFAKDYGLLPRAGRLDARLFPALRHLSQQRHRRRLGPRSLPVSPLYKKCNKKPGIVVANAGDGAAARGPVYEAMNFRFDGSVRPAVGGRLQGRPSHHLQLQQQRLRHGRPDRRRDDGLPATLPASAALRATR